MRAAAVLAGLVLLGAQSLHAAPILFDNGLPSGNGGYQSDNVVGRFMADDFTLTVTSTVTRVNFYGAWSGGDGLPPPAESFGVIFWADSGGGSPAGPAQIQGEPVATTRSNSGFTIGSVPVFRYTANISDLTLGPGTYWLTVANLAVDPQDDAFFWALTGGGNGTFGAESIDAGSSWTTVGNTLTDREFAFSLVGVPEPSSLALLCLGLSGVAWRRRVRRS